MRKNRRCPICGRIRKPSHDRKASGLCRWAKPIKTQKSR